ncbi:MAG: hypothetical protein IT371_24810 [Deltaproteobacteria bacterium]|nr:hypothetical protein [Deltaproteobacteria bacterium]
MALTAGPGTGDDTQAPALEAAPAKVLAREIRWERAERGRRVRLHATRGAWEPGEVAYEFSGVVLEDPPLRLEAKRARLDRRRGVLQAWTVVLEQGELRLDAEQVGLEMQSGALTGARVRAVLGSSGSSPGAR